MNGTSLLLLLAPWNLLGAPSLFSPFDVGCESQLFVDQVLVRSAEKVAFTLHPAQKHPANPLLTARAGGGDPRLYLCGSVIYDEEERLFKMWFLGGNGTTYAISRDGLKWEQQEGLWKGFMFASVWKDREDPDPARRYKIIAWAPNAEGVKNTWYNPPIDTGYNTYISPDGRQVFLHSRQPICMGGDVISGYYDRRHRLYVAFPKIMTEVRGFRRRCFYLTTSTDFVAWSEPKPVFVPDLQDDAGSLARIEEVRPILDVPDNPAQMRTEFYGVGIYQAESCVLAFPWIFTINASRRSGPHEGPSEVQLAVSRDLEHWERPFRLPCIPRGKPGEWDCGFFETASEAFRVGDEIWLYYSATNHGHGHEKREGGPAPDHAYGIGLATWKLDRFVSVDASAEGGTLTTVPLRFRGHRLEINARTKPDGEVVVEILAMDGKVLARSRPVVGDRLRHRVAWQQPMDLGALAGKPIALRFRMKHAELYAFAFREGESGWPQNR